MCWDTSIQLWGPCPFKTFKQHSLFFVPGAPDAGTHSQVLLSCFPSFQHPTHALCLRSGLDGWGWVFSSPGLLLPPHFNSSPLAGSWSEGRSGSARLRLVSYPLHEALGSLRCGCGLDVVLCPLVCILGRVICVIFSYIYMWFWEEISAALLTPPSCLPWKSFQQKLKREILCKPSVRKIK